MGWEWAGGNCTCRYHIHIGTPAVYRRYVKIAIFIAGMPLPLTSILYIRQRTEDRGGQERRSVPFLADEAGLAFNIQRGYRIHTYCTDLLSKVYRTCATAVAFWHLA
jgi:hypothetical protein